MKISQFFIRLIKIYSLFLLLIMSFGIFTAIFFRYKHVDVIRSWVYENTIIGDGPTWTAKETYGKNIAWIYSYYRRRVGGGKCNNIAYFFRKILDFFGFTSFEYHFGLLNGYNHVVNLVKINEAGEDIYSVQDAYYNISFFDTNGRRLDFFTMINLIKLERYEKIVVKPEYSGKRGYLLNNSNIVRFAYRPTRNENIREYYRMFTILRGIYGEGGTAKDWNEVKKLLYK